MIASALAIFIVVFIIGMIFVDRHRDRLHKTIVRHHRETVMLCDDIITRHVPVAEQPYCKDVLREHLKRQTADLSREFRTAKQ